MKTGLDATTTVLDGIGETLRTFRQNLISASSGKPLDAQRASDLQQAAFRAMQDMQNFLNTDVDGRHLFASSRVQTQPVSLPVPTLAEFQMKWVSTTIRHGRIGLRSACQGDKNIR
jgi:flagellin-like hook-associated protein FlgL